MGLLRWYAMPAQIRSTCALCVPGQKGPTRDILHTVFEARQLHIRGIRFLGGRFRSHLADAARI